jgi:beta-N-acetylhexosaminidase
MLRIRAHLPHIAGLFLFLMGSALLEGTDSVPDQTKTVKQGTSQGSPLLRSLTLRDRVAQLIIVRGYGDYPPSSNVEYERFRHWIHDLHVGGFIVAGRIRNGNVLQAPPFEMSAFINHMQRQAKTPLLVGADLERGASQRVAQTPRFPYMMAFGAAHDTGAIRELGAVTAREARAVGVNWVFAPDADVNNNPDNPIINIRSFGENPEEVAEDVSAFIEGAHSSPSDYLLVSAKHFPGHGDTAEDTHLKLATISASKDRLESVELVPFRAAIQHGTDSIMTAHLAVPAIEPENLPATLSHNILTRLLRDELGFKGIIVTDALEMQGVAALYSPGEAAVRSVEAGADALLMPTDPEACINALVSAVLQGRISRQRIDASVSRLIAAKQRVGLFRRRSVDLDEIPNALEERRFDDLAQTVANHAFTLVKDEKHQFPMVAAEGSCLAVLSEDDFSTHGDAMVLELKRHGANLPLYVVHSGMPEDLLEAIAGQTSHCQRIYAAAFVTVSAGRGNVALDGGLSQFLKLIEHGPVPVALISLGNPYLLRDFPGVTAYAATFSPVSTSETATAKAILGEIPITGKMPVSIPGFAKVGDGLNVPARAMTASN